MLEIFIYIMGMFKRYKSFNWISLLIKNKSFICIERPLWPLFPLCEDLYSSDKFPIRGLLIESSDEKSILRIQVKMKGDLTVISLIYKSWIGNLISFSVEKNRNFHRGQDGRMWMFKDQRPAILNSRKSNGFTLDGCTTWDVIKFCI